MRVDIHQHIWTDSLLDALSARDTMPFVRNVDGLTTLHCCAELPYVIHRSANAPETRAQLVREDGLDLALVAISSPIGIEALPRDEARPLIDAYLAGVTELPNEFAAWGPVALSDPGPGDVDELLARGCIGTSLPAGALAGPAALGRIRPLLERIEAHGAPLLVHPGPAPGDVPAHPFLGEPLWWRALTDYVAQMQAAWLTFATAGRREHPDLVVVFAMLAGGAPLLSERLTARGGPAIDLRDPRTYYDTSSYGPSAIAAMSARVGRQQLLYGSDRPVVDPVPAPAVHTALLKENSARLISRAEAVAA
jgi:predicted TIM-barrel fold metal-dependent hydrolase